VGRSRQVVATLFELNQGGLGLGAECIIAQGDHCNGVEQRSEQCQWIAEEALSVEPHDRGLRFIGRQGRHRLLKGSRVLEKECISHSFGNLEEAAPPFQRLGG
jgi:hypothetical protein